MLANLAHSVSSVSVVLLLTATGYVCAVRGWIGPDAKAFLSRFIMTVAIPCMCIYGLTTRLTREMLAEYGRYLLVPLCCISLNYLLSFLLGRLLRLPRRSLGVFVVMCSMSNTMFIGYAMCYELFGEESVPYIMLFYLVSTMFTQVVGLSVIRWAGESQHPSPRERLRFLTSPAVLGVAAGFTLVLLGWPLPSLVRSYMGYMNGLVSPLALVLTGKIIHDIGLRSLRLDRNAVLMLLASRCDRACAKRFRHRGRHAGRYRHRGRRRRVRRGRAARRAGRRGLDHRLLFRYPYSDAAAIKEEGRPTDGPPRLIGEQQESGAARCRSLA